MSSAGLNQGRSSAPRTSAEQEREVSSGKNATRRNAPAWKNTGPYRSVPSTMPPAEATVSPSRAVRCSWPDRGATAGSGEFWAGGAAGWSGNSARKWPTWKPLSAQRSTVSTASARRSAQIRRVVSWSPGSSTTGASIRAPASCRSGRPASTEAACAMASSAMARGSTMRPSMW